MNESMQTKRDKIKEYFSDRRHIAMAVFAVVAIIVLIIGLCLSWFVEQERLATVGKVPAPGLLKITGPGEDAITEIDLSYSPDTFKDSDKITLRRGFSVVSPEGTYTLLLAHTTNIPDLHIKLYRAVDAQNETPDLSGFDSTNAEYKWKKADSTNLYTKKSGTFKNIQFENSDDEGNSLAKDLESPNAIFSDVTAVQTNAIPLYWESSQTAGTKDSTKYRDKEGKALKVTDYIIEISWTDTGKETDMLYLIARQ